jgi:hypothetical protein
MVTDQIRYLHPNFRYQLKNSEVGGHCQQVGLLYQVVSNCKINICILSNNLWVKQPTPSPYVPLYKQSQ